MSRNLTLSRRHFLKTAGVGAVIMATGGWSAPTAQAANAPAQAPSGLLVDLTRCTGCEACVLACKQSNNRPYPDEVATVLSSDAYSCLQTRQLNPNTVSYVKRQCMHCLSPACASACTVGALQKTAAGPVVYDETKCIGCRYCQYACPFGVPTFDWASPLGLIHKCQFCRARLEQGQHPACAEACPNGALRFGRRDDLLAQAHAQIESNPGRYLNHIYGENEAGGTSILYLSDISFTELGFPELGPEPIPHQAESVMRQTPLVAASVAGLATLLSWLTQRRRSLAPTPHKEAES